MQAMNKVTNDDRRQMLSLLGIHDSAIAKWSGAKSAAAVDADEVYLYGPIVGSDLEAEWFGGVTGAAVSAALKSAEPKAGVVTLRINSPGGYVDEASVIRTRMQEMKAAGTKVDIKIDGMAGSAATLVALEGDNVGIADLGEVFVHRPSMGAYGNADNMRAAAETLDKTETAMTAVYNDKLDFAKSDYDGAAELMRGTDGEGTWLTPQEAIGIGFANYVITGGGGDSAAAGVEAQIASLENENQVLKRALNESLQMRRN